MEIIKAISQLWPLCLIILLGILIFVFKKQLKDIMEHFSKINIKRGGTELTIERKARGEEIEKQDTAQPIMAEQSTELIAKKETEVSKKTESAEAQTPDNWIYKMIEAFQQKDINKMEEAFNKYLECETDEEKKLHEKAFYLWLRYGRSDVKALDELIAMSNDESVNIEARHVAKRYVGSCYLQVDNFDMGLRAYQDALGLAETEVQKANDINDISRCMYKLGEKDDAAKKIMKALSETKEKESLSLLYMGLAGIYELEVNYEFRALALDKALELKPNDTNARFLAGYSYGQGETKSLALLHYKALLGFEPDNSMALNNIGVEYQQLGMNIKSVINYKKSAEKNETLAMGNLARKLLLNGFTDEASEILNKAKNQDNVHENVGRIMSLMKEQIEEEDKSEEKEINKAREQQRFFLEFAGAYFKETNEIFALAGKWETQDNNEIEIVNKEGLFEGYWAENNQKYMFTGKIINRGAKLVISKWQYIWNKSEIGYDKDSSGYIYISEDGKRLVLMRIKENSHSIMKFGRKSE